jgi:predicted transcriptional regulator
MTTKTAVLTLRLDTDLMDLCKAIAKKEEVPVSIVIRRAIRKGLNTTGLLPKTGDEQLPDWD